MPAGSYTVSAVATDNLGAETTATAGITVVDPGPSQVTSVVAPATPAVGQAVTVTTYGTNPCGALYLGWGDGNGWHHAIWELPYSYTYTWGAPGTYTITAEAHGGCTGQASTVITVTGEELDAEEPADEPEEVGWWPLEGESEEDGAALDPWAPDAVSRGRVVVTGRAVGTSGWTAAPAATADAAPQTMATLVVQLAGTGSGRVHISGAADCVAPSGGSCSESFPSGTAVTLTATPDAGSSFAGWGGACGGTAACALTLSQATLVVATFHVPPPLVTQYYHVDMLGSVRAVTDDTGAVLRRYDYAAFGEEFVEELAWTVPADGKQPRFVGKERDAETYLDYFGARYYRNRWGRFTTVDPGHVGGDIFNPQSWNAYAYALNNPLRFVDPLGMEPCQITLRGADAAAAGVADGGTVEGECVRPKESWTARLSRNFFGVLDILTLATPVHAPGMGQADQPLPDRLPDTPVLVAATIARPSQALMTSRGSLLGAARNPRLRDAITNLYRPGAKLGSGSSMDAVRIEGSHIEKVLGRRTQLRRILREENLDPSDRQLVKELLIDIQDALGSRLGSR